MEAPTTSEMMGRYSMGNSTALVMSEIQPTISYKKVSELCNTNGLHFNGFSLLTINKLQEEQVTILYLICIRDIITVSY